MNDVQHIRVCKLVILRHIVGRRLPRGAYARVCRVKGLADRRCRRSQLTCRTKLRPQGQLT